MALTFDIEHPDRPTRPEITPRLLDELVRLDVGATAFVQGRWAEAYPEVAARIAREGHLVGSHSHYHARMPLFNRPGLRSDIRTAERHIRRLCGVDPRPWFRLPFGDGTGDRLLEARIAALGYRVVGWHVDARDWASRRAGPVLDRVVDGVMAHGDGSVVLLHGWPGVTLDAVPRICDRLRAAGAEFVRIDELDGVPADRGPDAADAPPIGMA